MHYVINNTKIPRHIIAQKIGISRQTLYDREYMLTSYKTWMLDELLTATGFNPDRIPAHIHQRALDLETGAVKPAPRIPKNPAAESRQVETTRTAKQQDMDARLAAAIESPGIPPRDIEHLVMKTRTNERWPNQVKPLLDPLPPYEMVLTPRHHVPWPNSPSGLLLMPAYWYFKTLDGIFQFGDTRAEALKKIEDWRKRDAEALARDLI